MPLCCWRIAEDLTPQPPSLQGNGEQESFLPLTRKESLKAPLRDGEGFGEGSNPP
jgi:hypothetical protein